MSTTQSLSLNSVSTAILVGALAVNGAVVPLTRERHKYAARIVSSPTTITISGGTAGAANIVSMATSVSRDPSMTRAAKSQGWIRAFLRELAALESKGALDEAVYRVIREVNALFAARDFAACDCVFALLIPTAMTPDLMVAFLGSTLPARGRLRHRHNFAVAARHELQRRGVSVAEIEAILGGLC